jgi:hypothetical protein
MWLCTLIIPLAYISGLNALTEFERLLINSAESGDIDGVERALKHDVNTNIDPGHNEGALQNAARNGFTYIAELLLNYKNSEHPQYEVNADTIEAAIDVALAYNHQNSKEDMINLLFRYNKRITASLIEIAFELNKLTALKTLLKNAPDDINNIMTPFEFQSYLTEYPKLYLITFFLARGANIPQDTAYLLKILDHNSKMVGSIPLHYQFVKTLILMYLAKDKTSFNILYKQAQSLFDTIVSDPAYAAHTPLKTAVFKKSFDKIMADQRARFYPQTLTTQAFNAAKQHWQRYLVDPRNYEDAAEWFTAETKARNAQKQTQTTPAAKATSSADVD